MDVVSNWHELEGSGSEIQEELGKGVIKILWWNSWNSQSKMLYIFFFFKKKRHRNETRERLVIEKLSRDCTCLEDAKFTLCLALYYTTKITEKQNPGWVIFLGEHGFMTLHGVLQVQNSKLIISAFDYDDGAGEKDNFRLWIGTHFFFFFKLSLNLNTWW